MTVCVADSPPCWKSLPFKGFSPDARPPPSEECASVWVRMT